MKGGTKVRHPQRGLAENGDCTAASVAAGAVIGQEALECTATWINGLQFGTGFWFSFPRGGGFQVEVDGDARVTFALQMPEGDLPPH